MKKLTAWFLSICLVALTLMPLNLFAAAEAPNFVTAVDYSVLTAGNYYGWVDNCTPESTNQLITSGLLLDDASTFGKTEGMTCITGMRGEDRDANTVVDHLLMNPRGDTQRFHITLAANSTADYATDAVAFAIHIANDANTGGWADGSKRQVKITLIDNNDVSYEMLQASQVADKTMAYYANVTDSELTATDIKTQGYPDVMMKKDGWLIVPLAAFGSGLDLSNLKAVKIDAPAQVWDIYFTVAEIGFVKDVAQLINDKTGITVSAKAEIPAEAGFISALDVSVVAPGMYRDTAERGWDYNVDADSPIRQLWVDNDSAKGGVDSGNWEGWYGITKTNMHGFKAFDTTGDGITDSIGAVWNNDSGAFFTLGLNEDTSRTDATAVAIHMDNSVNSPYDEDDWRSITLTLYDEEENAYTMRGAAAGSYRVVSMNDKSISENNAYRRTTDCWYIIDIAAFNEAFDADDIVKVKVNYVSDWNYYFNVSDFGFVKNVSTFTNYLTAGNLPSDEEDDPQEPTTANFVKAVDYSVLTASDFFDNSNCTVDSSCELLTKNFWLDGVSDRGTAEGQTRIRRILGQDADGNGTVDQLAILPWGDSVFHFTFAANSTEDFVTDSTAIAIHINNTGSTGLWPDGSVGSLKVTLSDEDENTYTMLNAADVTAADATAYYANMTDQTLNTRIIKSQGYFGYMCKKDGWVVIPLSAFEQGFDLADITRIKVEASTIWDVYFTVGEIGFVKDAAAFVTEKTGITPCEESKPNTAAGYMEAVDFSVLTSATYRDYAPNWNGIIPTDAEIITKGIWVDSESAKGLEDADKNVNLISKTNLHGFIATDKTADGKTDMISPMPNNNSGMKFTLGVNTGNDFTDAKAIAVHIDNYGSTVWNDASVLGLDVTLYDSEDNAYRTRTTAELADAGVDAYSYYVNLTDAEFDYANIVTSGGYKGYRANKNGWYIIDLAAFEQGFDLSDIVKVKFATGSYWGGECGLEDIGFIYDVDNFAEYLLTGEVATPAAPDAATVFAKGATKLILNEVAGAEYSLDGENFTSSNVFEGLTVGQTYTVYQRIAATTSANASAVSEAATFTLYYEGDMDHNGTVDSDDLVNLRKCLLNVEFSGDTFAADANMDGEINILDLVRMKKLAA